MHYVGYVGSYIVNGNKCLTSEMKCNAENASKMNVASKLKFNKEKIL